MYNEVCERYTPDSVDKRNWRHCQRRQHDCMTVRHCCIVTHHTTNVVDVPTQQSTALYQISCQPGDRKALLYHHSPSNICSQCIYTMVNTATYLYHVIFIYFILFYLLLNRTQDTKIKRTIRRYKMTKSEHTKRSSHIMSCNIRIK